MGSQDAPKIHKNHEKMLFKIAFDFRIVFDTIFHQFFLDFRSHWTPKIKLKRWSVVIFYTFSDFRFGSLVESILDDFGIDFGKLLASIFEYFQEKGVSKKSSKFHVDFFTFFVDFRLRVGPQPAHDSGEIRLLTPPRPSWRHYFDSIFLLASFWDGFGSILGGFGTDFSYFSVNFSIIFV